MNRNFKLEKLQNGESFITSEKGNSMVPLIKSGQDHRLEPTLALLPQNLIRNNKL